MKYLLLAFPLFIYFELLGRVILLKFNKKPLDISFGVGLVFTMAALYVFGWPISAFDAPSIYYVIFVLVNFAIGSILIVVNSGRINFKLDIKLWGLFLILLAFEIYMSSTRTLGEPHGFDAVYYINYLSSNVDTPALNSVHPLFGTTPNTFETRITYYFQSINYFIPSFIFIIQKMFGILNKSIDFLPAYVWTFQILLHMLFISVSLISIKELNINNRILKVALVFLLILFLNNLYYNNAYGFIGNSYRMSIHALASIFLFRFFNSNDRNDFFIFLVLMIGLCGFSSTGTFALVFILFGLFYYLYDKEKNLIKYYAVSLVIPAVNILCVKLGVNWFVAGGTILLFVIIYILNDFILNLFRNKYLRYGLIILITVFMIAMSVFVTKKPSIFYGFLNNYSEFQDMSWDYFSFYDYRHWIFNAIVLVPLFYHLIKNHRHPFSIACIVMMVSVFNPFGANFMNTINWVYYRTYDLIINQYTLAYFIVYLVNNLKYKEIASSLVLLSSLILAVTEIPKYYHEAFKPDDDYNVIYKIENSELELINNVKQLIQDREMKNPKIINCTYYMNSFIKDGIYMIGKERRYNMDKFDQNSYDLYTIFFPRDGWDNFAPEDEPMYDIVIRLLKESDYDILIVDYGNFVTYQGQYMALVDAVTSDGAFVDSGYSTAKYAVIDLKQ